MKSFNDWLIWLRKMSSTGGVQSDTSEGRGVTIVTSRVHCALERLVTKPKTIIQDKTYPF